MLANYLGTAMDGAGVFLMFTIMWLITLFRPSQL